MAHERGVRDEELEEHQQGDGVPAHTTTGEGGASLFIETGNALCTHASAFSRAISRGRQRGRRCSAGFAGRGGSQRRRGRRSPPTGQRRTPPGSACTLQRDAQRAECVRSRKKAACLSTARAGGGDVLPALRSWRRTCAPGNSSHAGVHRRPERRKEEGEEGELDAADEPLQRSARWRLGERRESSWPRETVGPPRRPTHTRESIRGTRSPSERHPRHHVEEQVHEADVEEREREEPPHCERD